MRGSAGWEYCGVEDPTLLGDLNSRSSVLERLNTLNT